MNAIIIVPLDGSPLAEQALPIAARLAHGMRAELLITHVIDPMATHITRREQPSWTIEDERLQMRQTSTRYLEHIKEMWATAAVPMRAEVIEGGIGEAIVQLARDVEPTYIVMTTHAKTGLARVALGSVADYVMQESPCPVVLVPPQPVTPPVHMVPVRSILVPLDGSLFSEQALPYAQLLANTFNARLHLYRVTAIAPTMAGYGERFPRAEAIPDTTPLTEQYLSRVQRELVDKGYNVDSNLGVGAAGPAIVAEADAQGADLIVMTTHARTGLARTVMGSTADYVVRHGHLPVLLVRPE